MTTHTATTTATTATNTTTAVVLHEVGGALTLETVPAPVAGPGEVLVDVAYAGVNPVDLTTRSGFFHQIGLIAPGATVGLGWEVSGTVVGTGTRVAALVPGLDRPVGGYASRVVVPESDLAVVPDGLALRDAATVPLTGLTAAQLVDLAGPGAGRSLLVTGAAGAVGFGVLLLAREQGYDVTGLARAGDEELVTGAGAAFVTAAEPAAYDVVVDAAVLVDAALEAVTPGGTYLGVIPAAPPADRPGITVAAVSVVPDGERLADLLRRTASGELPTRIAGVLPLAEAAEAHRALEAGGVRGRYLLQV